MARAIDADEFERFLMNLPDEVLCEDCCYVIVNEMRKQPTIEAEPVMHGKWIIDGDCTHCSECRDVFGCTIMGYFTPKHCPNCGARMDGDSE